MEEKTLTFEEKLSKLLELAKSKKNVLDEKEVLDAFAGEELTPEKLDRIYDFLDKKHVDVLKMSNDDDMDPDLFSEDEDADPEDDIDVDQLADMTDGYIASDIAYIVNDSAMVAAYTRTKISKELLLSSVTNTRPSVRSESIKQYDDIRKKMEDTNRRNVTDRTRIVTW